MSDHVDRRSSDIAIAMMRVEVDAIKKDMGEVKGDVKGLLAIANQSKGGLRTVILIASIGGAVGALLAKLAPLIGGMPR